MFTGIIEQTGQIQNVLEVSGYLQIRVRPTQMWQDLQLGESIANNGTCLTVVAFDESSYTVELSKETIAKTAACWHQGSNLNLERAMRADGRFGGHVVSGHVDGIGTICSIETISGAHIIVVKAPLQLAKYLVPKGSITVNGVSLTVVDVGGPGGTQTNLTADQFTLWLIPHTLKVTNLSQWQINTQVNLEADQFAKYTERLLLMRELEPTRVNA